MAKKVFLMNSLQLAILVILAEEKGVFLASKEIEKRLPKNFKRPAKGGLCGASLMHMRKKGWVKQHKGYKGDKTWYITSGSHGKGKRILAQAQRSPDKVEPYATALRHRRGLKDAKDGYHVHPNGKTPKPPLKQELDMRRIDGARDQAISNTQSELAALKRALGVKTASETKTARGHEVTLRFEGFEITIKPV